jgi:hypothetical protein
MAIVLLIAMFPAVFFGILLGIVVHPAFFLLLLALFFAVPAGMALFRKSA